MRVSIKQRTPAGKGYVIVRHDFKLPSANLCNNEQKQALLLLVMSINNDAEKDVSSRLARALAHLHTAHRMIDNKQYCIDILFELKDVQANLDQASELMLKNHLETCLVEAIQNNDSARVMEELWQLLRKKPDSEMEPD